MKFKILLIDDDPLWQLSFGSLLEAYGTLSVVDSASAARNLLSKENFDIAFIDLDLEERLIGLELVKLTKQKNIYNVIVSSNDTDEIINNGYLAGCMDYLAKPVSEIALKQIFKKFQNLTFGERINKFVQERFITRNPILQDTLEIVKSINLSQKSILLTGESGTGKSHLAKIIHEISQLTENSKSLPFVALNCSQFNETTIDSELFGHVKGAFTGAIKDKKGLIEKAQGGTLFLDEIHALSLKSQQKLLTALDNGIIYPVGSETPKKVNFRVICATCESIEELVAHKEFRKDLYYRIKTFILHIPPLRERPEDILPLFEHAIGKRERRMVLTETAKEALLSYDFPANTREVEDLVENWSIMGLGRIDKSDLPNNFNRISNHLHSTKLSQDQIETLKKVGLKIFLDQIKIDAIETILAEGVNQSDVAKVLGVSKSMISKELAKNENGVPNEYRNIQ